MRHRKLVSTRGILLAAMLVLIGTSVMAGRHHDRDDESSDEIPFDVAEIYFELNNTDGDLGIHALIDGGPWKSLSIETPDERENLQVRLKSRLRRQGLTEFFFESSEPTFDVLAPTVFFRRFPEGSYEVEGKTLEGEELESSALVTHRLPAPPSVSANGVELPDGCDDDPLPVISEPVTLHWDPVHLSHPDLGRTNEPIEVVRYQLVVEREEPTPLILRFDLAPDVNAITLPDGILGEENELKVEVLVREISGNQTATESCFETE